jgi:hypothetical protein
MMTKNNWKALEESGQILKTTKLKKKKFWEKKKRFFSLQTTKTKIKNQNKKPWSKLASKHQFSFLSQFLNP